jgi:hypothetical protein
MTMDIEMYANRIATLTGKAKEASVRVIVTEANLTDLIVDGPEDDLARVRADHQAAVIDRDALVRGLEEAEYHLSDAKTLADLDVVLGNCAKIEKLVKQRTKLLNEAEKAFLAFMDKIDDAEAVAVEIRSAGAGARELGNALNRRIGHLGGWFTTRFYHRFGSPELDQAISGAIANHNHAIAQLDGKSLADLDEDYAALYRQHHADKLEKANDQEA